jgi:deoxyribose-phosphate aldolase
MNITPEKLAGLIDHTLLKPDATSSEISQLCLEAVEHNFKSVCLNSCHVPLAYRELAHTQVAICAVVGFPLGACLSRVKAFEATEAVQYGAKEVDVVLNVGYLKSGLLREVAEDLRGVVTAVKMEDKTALVKVILETCLLSDREKTLACGLAVDVGAEFVKTSTGFNVSGATTDDIRLMRQTVGPLVGVKASGGIRTLSQALAMLEAGADRLGVSAGVRIMAEL